VRTNPTSGTSASTSGNTSASSGGDWSANANKLKSGRVFTEIKKQLDSPEGKASVDKLQAIFRFTVSQGDNKVSWTVDLKNGNGSVSEGDATKPDTTFILTDDNFINLAIGKSNPQVAFMRGNLKLSGNIAKAMSFNTHVFQKYQERIKEAVKSTQAKL